MGPYKYLVRVICKVDKLYPDYGAIMRIIICKEGQIQPLNHTTYGAAEVVKRHPAEKIPVINEDYWRSYG